MFEGIIGNSKAKQYLEQTVQNEKILHSYLFVGQEGIGKKKIAEEYAKILLCNKHTGKDSCKSCLEIETGNNPDYQEIDTEESSIKIEQIRQMQKKIAEKPIISEKKVYIINDAEKMTIEAQNCLLKTLEEPPEYICIILITSNENKIINTIKSRCTVLNFKPIEDEALKQFLEKELEIKNIDETQIKRYNGSIKAALEIQESHEIYDELEKYFGNIEKYKTVDTLGKIKCLYERKEKIKQMLEYINKILIEKASQNVRYIKYIETIEKAKQKISRSANYDMTIDYIILNIFR